MFSNDKGRRATKPLVIAPSDVFCRMIDVELINDCTHSENDFEMCHYGRNLTPMVVGMAESFKSSLFDVGENIVQCEEQVR